MDPFVGVDNMYIIMENVVFIHCDPKLIQWWTIVCILFDDIVTNSGKILSECALGVIPKINTLYHNYALENLKYMTMLCCHYFF